MIPFIKEIALKSRIMIMSLTLLACVENKRSPTPTVMRKVPQSVDSLPKPSTEVPNISVIPGPNSRKICMRPTSIKQNPETFEDVVRLINALPKPVSVPCFLDTLEPPFYVNATSSVFSGQPAGDAHSPRIFLFVGRALVISVVPSGVGSTMIEFSLRLNADDSIKGELAFPVVENLSLEAPYTHILTNRKDATVCQACHFPERTAPEGFPETAFVSRWISAMEDYDVTVRAMEKINEECKINVGDHCPIIQSLFFRGKVYGRSFDP